MCYCIVGADAENENVNNSGDSEAIDAHITSLNVSTANIAAVFQNLN